MTTERKVSVQGSIAPKHLGAPQILLAQPETVREFYMGYILGVASGIVTSDVADQRTGVINTLEGLKGTFRAIPEDTELNADRPSIQAGKLWLPEGIAEPIIAAVKEAAKTGGSVKFGYHMKVIRSTAPAGYGWAAEPTFDVAKDDPLEAMTREVTGISAKAVEKRADAPAIADGTTGGAPDADKTLEKTAAKK